MRKKGVLILASIVLIAGLMGCAGKNLTADQEARIVLNSIQENLNTLFDTGKAYVVANPKYQQEWKTKVVPAFDIANKSVKSGLDLAKQGKFTSADVKAKVLPLVNSLIAMLGQMGVIK